MRIPKHSFWAISPNHMAQMLDTLRAAPKAELADLQRSAGPAQVDVLQGVAVIRISGVLVKETNTWLRALGFISSRDIARQVDIAARDESVGAIVLWIDSPGGSTDGISELGDAVYAARARKPIVAQVDGCCASAGYWVASQTNKIYASKLDEVGSIGVRMLLYDLSKLFQAEGVEPVVIDTGKYKSAGAIGTEITDEHRAYFQDIVDKTFAEFIAVVGRGRNMQAAAVRNLADGRVWLADDAKALGLIDGIQGLDATVGAMLGMLKQSRVRTARAKAARMGM